MNTYTFRELKTHLVLEILNKALQEVTNLKKLSKFLFKIQKLISLLFKNSLYEVNRIFTRKYSLYVFKMVFFFLFGTICGR